MSRIVVLKVPGEKLSEITPAVPKGRAKAAKKRGGRTKVAKVERKEEEALPKSVPKASLGAVNASLRALDTSGRPCRRWTRQPLTISSFTGHKMVLRSWVGGSESETLLGGGDGSAEGANATNGVIEDRASEETSAVASIGPGSVEPPSDLDIKSEA